MCMGVHELCRLPWGLAEWQKLLKERLTFSNRLTDVCPLVDLHARNQNIPTQQPRRDYRSECVKCPAAIFQ